MPFVGRLILALALVALGLGVLYVGMGGLGKVVGALGSTVGGFVEGVTATASPQAVRPAGERRPDDRGPGRAVHDRRRRRTSSSPSRATWPAMPTYKLRIYLALKDQAPAAIDEVPIAVTPTTNVPVELTKGVNDFTVTIVGPSGESDPSAVVSVRPGHGTAEDHDRVADQRCDRQRKGRRRSPARPRDGRR